MRSRGLVVALALLLAIGATAAVFLYVSSVKEEARTGGDLVTVIVSSEDIEANTELDALIAEGVFQELDIPSDALVSGAVQDAEQLAGRTTTSAILAEEQIPLERLSGGAAAPGGQFGLREGYQAITVKLDAEQLVGEALRVSDHVTFYAAFAEGVSSGTLKDLGFDVPGLTDVSQASQAGSQDAPTSALKKAAKGLLKFGAVGGPQGVVVMAVADARVLGVTTQVTAPQTSVNGVNQGEPDAVDLVTLELTPEDAQRLVFAQNEGRIWYALIRPGDDTAQVPPLDFYQFVGEALKGQQ